MTLMRLSNVLLTQCRHTLLTTSACLRLCSSSNTSSPQPTKAGATKGVPGPPELKEKKWQMEFYQKENGVIAGKMPVKISFKKGKTYAYCTCGYSKNQPLCDNTHTNRLMRTKLRPLVFKAPEDVDVWLCTCKQTKNKPFCDGTHRTHPEVLEWKP